MAADGPELWASVGELRPSGCYALRVKVRAELCPSIMLLCLTFRYAVVAPGLSLTTLPDCLELTCTHSF